MFAGFITLLDNYERSSGVAEVVTVEELAEINLFLDAVLETEVMKVYYITFTKSLISSFHDSLFPASYSFWNCFIEESGENMES